MALRNHPDSVEGATAATIAKAMSSDSDAVQGAACELAKRAKLNTFAQPLIEVLKTADNDWVMRAAFHAASECGVENDRRLELCLDRMHSQNNDWNMLMLSLLLDGSLETNGTGYKAIENWGKILPGLQNAWRKFIAENRTELRAGKLRHSDASSLSEKMFPPDYTVRYPTDSQD